MTDYILSTHCSFYLCECEGYTESASKWSKGKCNTCTHAKHLHGLNDIDNSNNESVAEEKKEDVIDKDTDIDIVLYSNEICPFSERAWLSLEYFKVPYKYFSERVAVGGPKQEWFKKLYKKAMGADPSSDGKSPLIYDKKQNIYLTESLMIVRYLNVKYGNQKINLLPNNPVENVQIELMTDWFNNNYIANHYKVLMVEEKQLDEAKKSLRSIWKTLNKKMLECSDKGLILKSDKISLFEICAWPLFERIGILDALGDCPALKIWINEKEFERINSWYTAMLKHEILQKTETFEVKPAKYFIDFYGSIPQFNRKLRNQDETK
eukprot:282611_1